MLSSTAEWICRETGVLPTQYTESAVEHLVKSIVLMLRSHKKHSSDLSMYRRRAVSSPTIREVSELCLPIIHHEKALPLVECLLECAFHTEDLSSSFWEKVASCQTRVGGEAGSEEGRMALSHEAKLALWCSHLPSFNKKLRDLMEELKDCHSQEGIKELILSHNLAQACLDRPQLFLFTDDFLSSSSTTQLSTFTDVLNQLVWQHYCTMVVRPARCPKFTSRKDTPHF